MTVTASPVRPNPKIEFWTFNCDSDAALSTSNPSGPILSDNNLWGKQTNSAIHTYSNRLCAASRWSGNYADPRRVRHPYQFVPVEKQCLVGGHRYRRGPGLPHRLDRGRADHRNVKPHILSRPGHFDDDERLAPGQLPGPRYHRVCPLHRLNSNHCPVFDRDGLPQVEPSDFPRDPSAVVQVPGLLFGRRPPAKNTLAR